MGDEADWCLEREMDEWFANGCPRRRHRKFRPRDDVICNQCGQGDLEWGETEKGWRPFENGAPHVCSEEGLHDAYADDFEDMEAK